MFNCDQDELADEDLKDRMRQVVAPAEAIFFDAKFEAELVEMDEEEGRAFLEEMGITEPGLNVLARVGYETLGLQSYLTAGPKEARAWTRPTMQSYIQDWDSASSRPTCACSPTA